MNHQKKNLISTLINYGYTLLLLCLEVQPPGEGDVHRLSEDGVPAGETGGSSARLPQKLLPLHSLQHNAQVSCCICPEFSFI